MHYDVEISREAELDIENAIDYYFAIDVAIVFRFRDDLYATYAKIIANPQFYKYLSKKKEKKYRCVQLKSFPYLVIYKISGNVIIVTSVFNTYRKPVYGQP